MVRLRYSFSILLFGLIGLMPRVSLAQYVFFPMENLSGSPNAQAAGINSAGQIVGTAGRAFRLFYPQPITPSTSLGLPSFQGTPITSFGVAINDTGHVAATVSGTNLIGGTIFRSYLVPANGTMSTATEVGSLGGQVTLATAINSSQQIAGTSALLSGADRAFRWTPGSGITDLGAMGGTRSSANDIDDAGRVVGTVTLPGGQVSAFRTQPNQPIQPGDLLGTLGGTFSFGQAINSAGQVAGYSAFDASGATRLFRTAPFAAINPATDGLTAFAGVTDANVHDMNSHGDLVGQAFTGSTPRAFIVDRSGTSLIDLNTVTGLGPEWILTAATGINDNGMITGFAERIGENTSHAYVLIPIPEPATLIAFVACVPVMRRRWN